MPGGEKIMSTREPTIQEGIVRQEKAKSWLKISLPYWPEKHGNIIDKSLGELVNHRSIFCGISKCLDFEWIVGRMVDGHLGINRFATFSPTKATFTNSEKPKTFEHDDRWYWKKK